jgi:hypothetical protein
MSGGMPSGKAEGRASRCTHALGGRPLFLLADCSPRQTGMPLFPPPRLTEVSHCRVEPLRRPRLDRGQQHVEYRALAGSTAYLDTAAMTGDDPCTTDRPKPVPSPTAFVVKNGSKMRSAVALSMPHPVSATVNPMLPPIIRTATVIVPWSEPIAG